METASKGDFIEIDFVGRIKGSNQIFDLTLVDVAKKENVFRENQKYKPMVACLGSGHLIKGLDREIQGKKIGEELTIEVLPKDAFGQKNPKLIQLTGTKIFAEKKIQPYPGLQISVDGALATVRSVNGGRVILDFNHPLSGKTLVYWIRINRKITNAKEKIEGLVFLLLNPEKSEVEIGEKEIKIGIENYSKSELDEVLKKQIWEFVPEAKGKEIKIGGIEEKKEAAEAGKPKAEASAK